MNRFVSAELTALRVARREYSEMLGVAQTAIALMGPVVSSCTPVRPAYVLARERLLDAVTGYRRSRLSDTAYALRLTKAGVDVAALRGAL